MFKNEKLNDVILTNESAGLILLEFFTNEFDGTRIVAIHEGGIKYRESQILEWLNKEKYRSKQQLEKKSVNHTEQLCLFDKL